MASSSGWAWKVTSVCGTGESSRTLGPARTAGGPPRNLTLELANFRFALVFWGVTDAWSSCDSGARESRGCGRGAGGGGAGLCRGRHAQPAVPAGGPARRHPDRDQRGRRGLEDQPARGRLRLRLRRRQGVLQHGQRLEGQGHLRAQAESLVRSATTRSARTVRRSRASSPRTTSSRCCPSRCSCSPGADLLGQSGIPTFGWNINAEWGSEQARGATEPVRREGLVPLLHVPGADAAVAGAEVEGQEGRRCSPTRSRSRRTAPRASRRRSTSTRRRRSSSSTPASPSA